jgi:4,5-DOPA dioxygenase extradiol
MDAIRPETGMGTSGRMPVLFVGHGIPTNAIEDNQFTQGWAQVAGALPRPEAILCVSAHWETRGPRVTAMDRPRTIHDFGGFPRELYEVRYPAPGSPSLARETQTLLGDAEAALDEEWGLDHGCWTVLTHMLPAADVPVVQSSLDVYRSPQEHYDLAKRLAPLRDRGVLIVASGNIVHNLGRVALDPNGSGEFNEPFGLGWALEAQGIIRTLIDSRSHDELIDYRSLGHAVVLAVASGEHYLPLLYALALQGADEPIAYYNDVPVGGSVTMTSLVVGGVG